ncbi:rab effector Noc2 isoform X4 [Onychostruthus taczanowskii]|uniref:rab effector Noc2 isoform X4 n=1 Tax=Onychostruthus taczanowskii TaxID=356909 RepID=UPI001B801156|nr:rab effector Noc2 isoform X4 [Onychostruthus taczanowskii]
MAEMIFGSGMGPWVCPNDRQLALRAKLQTGWSVHTFQTEKQRKMQALSPKELEVILGVIRKAEQLDVVEQQRVGRLVERLENMRKNAMGNGLSQCLLCGEMLGLLGSSSVFCQDCKKKVCTKCGIEAVGAQKRPLWLCKICSEQREWFPVTARATQSSAPPAWMTNPWDPKALKGGSSKQEWHPPGDPARPGAQPWGPPRAPRCGGATAAWAASREPSSAPRRAAGVTEPRAGATATPAPLANHEPTAGHGSDGGEDGAAFSWIQHCHSSDPTPDRSCCQW